MSQSFTPAPALAPGSASALPLTPDQIRILKSVAPLLQKQIVAISTLFYENILDENPSLKNMFNLTAQRNGEQPRALADAVIKYVSYIDRVDRFEETAGRIAHKHVSLQVQPGMYDLVGQYLLQAIGSVLGDKLTPDAVDAWKAAYRVLAFVFIKMEEEYRELGSSELGWTGWRKFRVAARSKANGSGSIVNFTLAPIDGKSLPGFEPGQYVSVRLFVPELDLLQSRQYSLSKGPGDGTTYEISVRRIEGIEDKPPGIISNMIHALGVGDEVLLSQPQGEFTVREQESPKTAGPLVLISAGVGATALMPMLRKAASSGQQVVWLHASHDMRSVPFWLDVSTLQKSSPGNVRVHLWLTDDKDFVMGNAGKGLITVGDHLQIAKFPQPDCHHFLWSTDSHAGYYICGPKSFMLQTRRALFDMGVPLERIHLELYATGEL